MNVHFSGLLLHVTDQFLGNETVWYQACAALNNICKEKGPMALIPMSSVKKIREQASDPTTGFLPTSLARQAAEELGQRRMGVTIK